MIFARSVLAACASTIAIALGGCGGGSSGGADGVVATGTITGFGSVYVNGVRYATDSTTFMIGDSTGSESDLAIGMVVRVNGTINDDGTTGTADSITYDAELKGPVASAPTADPDGENKTFTVLGTTVVANSITTVFDGAAGFGFDTLAENDVVEVSGFIDLASRTLYATRVEKEGTFNPANPGATRAEIEGLISNLDEMAMTFNVGTLTVSYDGSTELPGSGLADGLLVEAEGRMQDAVTLLADEIEIEDDDYPDDIDEAEVHGVVTEFTDLGNFVINGQVIDASGAGVEFEPASLADPGAIEVGTVIEVEGAIVAGVLIADEVIGRHGEIEIEAFVSAVDAEAQTVTLEAAPSQTIAVVVDPASTRLDDDDSDGDSDGAGLGLADINVGDYLEIAARLVNGDIVATNIQREDSDDEDEVEIEAPVESFDATAGTVTLLGVTFATDGMTEFEDDDSDLGSAADFFAALVNGMILEVKDTIPTGMTTGDGTADEIEIEDDDD